MRQAEVGAAQTMIEHVDERLGLYPQRQAAGIAYGTAEMLCTQKMRAIEAHLTAAVFHDIGRKRALLRQLNLSATKQ